MTSLLPIINGNSGIDALGMHMQRRHNLMIIKNKLFTVDILIS